MSDLNSYSSSEQLTALLDGELDGADAGTLFLEMANNPDLQSELVHQVSLRNSIQNGLVEPPAHLKAGIIQSIGLADGVAAAGVAAGATGGLLMGIKHFAASKAAAMLGSALLATLLTSIIFVSDFSPIGPAGQIAGNGTSDAASSNTTSSESYLDVLADAQMFASHQSSGDIDLARALTLDQILSAEAGYAQLQANSLIASAAGSQYANWNSANNTSAFLSSNADREDRFPIDPLDSDPLHGSASISDLIVRALAKHPEEPAAFRSIVVGDVNYSSNITGMGQGIQSSVAQLESKDLGLEVQMRGFMGHNFTVLGIQPQGEPVLNNFSVAALLEVDHNWSYGLEIGQETFNQSFTEDTRSETLLYEQRYVGFWAAAALQYRTLPVESLADAQFFSRIAVGGTEQGPVGRMMLGMQYSFDDRLAMLAGVEASSLLYNFQSSSHLSNKLAFTYGLAFKL